MAKGRDPSCHPRTSRTPVPSIPGITLLQTAGAGDSLGGQGIEGFLSALGSEKQPHDPLLPQIGLMIWGSVDSPELLLFPTHVRKSSQLGTPLLPKKSHKHE